MTATPSAGEPAPPDALPVGASIGGYLIESVLGQGGFGITYKALNPVTGRRVAIKEFFPQGLARRGGSLRVEFTTAKSDIADWAINRFRATTTTLCGLSHDNIIKVLDYVPANATGYMIMELLEGRTLSAWLAGRGSPPTLEELRPIVDPIMAALVYVHGEGLIHRDVAPDNILVAQDGRPVLIDFGSVSRELNEQGRGSTVSTFKAHYTAPEFMGPRATPDVSADVYSLGAVLYMAATGHEPADSRDRIGAVAFGAGPDPLVPLSGQNMKGWPPRAASAIDEALSLDKRKRPASVEILRRAFQPESVTALVPQPEPTPEPISDLPAGAAPPADPAGDAIKSRRSTGKLVAALCLAGLAFGAAAFGLSRVVGQRDVSPVVDSGESSRSERATTIGPSAPTPAPPSEDKGAPPALQPATPQESSQPGRTATTSPAEPTPTPPPPADKRSPPPAPQPATPQDSPQPGSAPAIEEGASTPHSLAQKDVPPLADQPSTPPNGAPSERPAATAQSDPPLAQQPASPPASEPPKPQPTISPKQMMPAAPVLSRANRASLSEKIQGQKGGDKFDGTVRWRLEPAQTKPTAGAARSSPRLVGTAKFAAIDRYATVTLSRDRRVPGAGIAIDIRFSGADRDMALVIWSVRELGTYWDDGGKYRKLRHRSTQPEGGGIRIELSREESERTETERLLRESQSIEINFTFGSSRDAVLTLDIGDQRDLFAQALDLWRDAALGVDEPGPEKRAEAPPAASSPAAAPAPAANATPPSAPAPAPRETAAAKPTPPEQPAATPPPAEKAPAPTAPGRRVASLRDEASGQQLNGSVMWAASQDSSTKAAKVLGTVRFPGDDIRATIVLAQDNGADRMRRLSISIDAGGKPSPVRIASLQRLGTTRDDGAKYEALSVRSAALQGDWFFIRLANEENDRVQFERLLRSKDMIEAKFVYEDGRSAVLTLEIDGDREVFAEAFDAWRAAAAADAEAALAAASRPPGPELQSFIDKTKQASSDMGAAAPGRGGDSSAPPPPAPSTQTATATEPAPAPKSAAPAPIVVAPPTPDPPKPTAPPNPQPAVKTAAAPVAKPPVIVAPRGAYWAQVAARFSAADARQIGSELLSRHSAAFGGRSPVIQTATGADGGVVYRVRIGPFGDRADASALCDRVKADGAECFVPNDEPASATRVAVAPKPAAGGTYWVQVTAKPSEAEARSDFASLQRRHPSLLGDRRPSIQIADIDGKGRYYRVRVGPFASNEDASTMCSSLRARGADCLIAR